MNQAANAIPPEYMELSRALKKVGLRPFSPPAFQKAVERFGASYLVDTAERAMSCERSRQWLISLASKSETAAGARPSARTDEKSWSPLTVHVYGNQAALCFEPTVSASKFPTVAIDAAIKNQGAGRTFDWAGKIQVNLTRDELVKVTAALLGFTKQASGSHHGPARNKGFRVTNQEAHFFFEVSEGDKPKRGVPIGPADAHYVTNLLLRQLQNASPWMSVSDVVTMIRCRAPMLNQDTANSRGGQQ